MKKTSRKTLKRKADKLFSELILLKGKCERCGIRRTLQVHHIIGRRNLNLRFDPKNAVCICSGCHTLRRDSAHQDPLGFQAWLIKKRRKDYNYLMFKRMELATQVDYEDIIKRLQDTLSSLKAS